MSINVKFKCPKCGRIFINRISKNVFEKINWNNPKSFMVYCIVCHHAVTSLPIPDHFIKEKVEFT